MFSKVKTKREVADTTFEKKSFTVISLFKEPQLIPEIVLPCKTSLAEQAKLASSGTEKSSGNMNFMIASLGVVEPRI